MDAANMGALVIELRATRSLTVTQHMGRAVQQFCLSLVRQVDGELSQQAHDNGQVKPYAVSGLLASDSTRALRGEVAPGDQAWVRLVGLRAEIVAALDDFAQHPADHISLDRTPWEVERAVWTEHPWAGLTGYHRLLVRGQQAAPPDAIHFEFVSPTAFSSADLNIPLPDPVRIFESLRKKWRALNTLPAACDLPDMLLDFVRYFVPLTEYAAHSELLMMKTPEIGFCADRVKLSIKPHVSVNSSLRRNNPEKAALLDALNNQRDNLARAVGLLADFAFFSGVGIKTTTGMGLARRG